MRRIPIVLLLAALPLLGGWTPLIGEPPTAAKKGKKLGVSDPAPAGKRNWQSGLSVETSSREAARVFYRAVYVASEGYPVGFTGNTALGVAGTTSGAFRDATALRANWFRAMAGVPADITFDPIYVEKAQKAALMMSANGKLSHYPDKGWVHYSDDGEDGARHSNLGLADNGPDAITSYMLDPGNSNAAVGHRRWLLYPATMKMGTGDVPKQGTHPAANALWVVDSSASSTRPDVRDALVAWPPKGFVPYGVVFARWSASVPKADFTKATVTMTKGGAPFGATIESSGPGGAGESSIVFRPEGMPSDGWGAHPRPTADVAYTVTLDNVLVDGKAKSFTYSVNVFDPALAGSDTVVPVLAGSATPKVGAQNAYTWNAVPRAEAYRIQEARLGKVAATLGAEGGLSPFIATTSPGYDPVAKDLAASGTASFHLAHPEPKQQVLELDKTLLPGKSTSITFKERLLWASSGQVARLQAKREGSGAWQELWSRAGSGGGDTGFASHTVSLAAFDGVGVRVRFVYDHTGGSYYPSVNKAGFYVDDVGITADEILPIAERDVPVGTLAAFTPSAAGTWALRVRPRFYGKYFLDYGPTKTVEASSTAPTPPPVPTTIPTTIATTGPSSTPSTAPPAPTGIAWPFPVIWPKPGGSGPPVFTIPELPAPAPFPSSTSLPFPLPLPKP